MLHQGCSTFESTFGIKKARRHLFVLYLLGCLCSSSMFLFQQKFLNSNYYKNQVKSFGASGAVLAILCAGFTLFPHSQVLLFFVLPVKSRNLLYFILGVSAFFTVFGSSSNISHAGHLGGALAGYFYVLRKFMRI